MFNVQIKLVVICLLHILYLCVEILEAFSTPPIHAMITESTTTQISTVSANDTQQFSRSITIHHTSNVSSVKHTTASVINITQLPQSEYLCSNYAYIITVGSKKVNIL